MLDFLTQYIDRDVLRVLLLLAALLVPPLGMILLFRSNNRRFGEGHRPLFEQGQGGFWRFQSFNILEWLALLALLIVFGALASAYGRLLD